MQAWILGNPMLALFNFGGGEIIPILVLLLILFMARKLPDIAKGLGMGMSEFRKAIDQEAHDAGKSMGGIYGKPAAQALTTDNQVAELYNPAALADTNRKPFRKRALIARLFAVFKWIWRAFLRTFKVTR